MQLERDDRVGDAEIISACMTRMPPRISRHGDGFRGSRGLILIGSMNSASPTTRAEEKLLEAARGGDDDAFGRLVEPHRRGLNAHCYRMLGSIHDAEDALQETLLRGWRGLPRFEGKSSLRAWLYRIATNTCRDLIERRPTRVLPTGYGPAADPQDDLGAPLVESVWVEPFPDEMLGSEDAQASPEARYEAREGVELAFVAALQHLPARQRAVLILREVLGFSADEVAEALETTPAAVYSALQRAHKAVEERLPEQSQQETLRSVGDEGVREIVESYVDAWERHDVEAVAAMLTEDAKMAMPPTPTWFRGREAVSTFLARGALAGGQSWRIVPCHASGQLAFGHYLLDEEGGAHVAHHIVVITLEGSRVAEITAFMLPDLFLFFGLPDQIRS
jgi:RNA polymerase sigma-70 factor, ECF subfamily